MDTSSVLEVPQLEYRWTALPASAFCRNIYKNREHALIGISPFNSYFSVDRIMELIHWGQSEFFDFQLFIPDLLSSYTFQALGYSAKRTLKKVSRQDSYLKNKIYRAFQQLGFNKEIAKQKMLCYSELRGMEKYQEVYDSYVLHYNENPRFREHCVNGARWVLQCYTSTQEVDKEALEIATRYFLAELPLLMQTPHILNVASSTFIYHTIPPAIADFYINRKLYFTSEKQGYLSLIFF